MTGNSWNIVQYMVVLFLFVLFLAVPLSAKEVVVTKTTGAAVAAFTATSTAASSLCAYETSAERILLKNKGTLPDIYTITLDAEEEAASWLTLSDTSVELQPGEEKEVFVYAKAKEEGSYAYTVTIASFSHAVKELQKTITVTSCPNIALKAYSSAQETCPCSTGVSVFELENTGNFPETYSLELAGMDEEYYVLSEYAVTLAPGEKKDIYAYVRMACFVWGSFDFTLHAETAMSRYTAEIPLSLEIPQSCYNYDIALGEAVLFEENETMDISFRDAEDTAYELCQETPAVIPVQIKNPGDVKNTYVLAIEDAEEWIVPAASAVQIPKEGEELTYIVVNPGTAEAGNYSFALKADSSRGDLEAVLPFTVAVEECEEKEMPSWLKYLLWGILALILLAILLALFMLWQRRKRTSEAGRSLQLEKAQKAATNFWQKHRKVLSILLPLLLLFFIIGSLAYPKVKEKYAEQLAEQATGVTAEQTTETLFYNWATALILLGTFLLLFLLLWYFKFQKKGKKKKRTGEKINWEKIKPVLKWVWILFLSLLLLSALVSGLYFLYKNYKEDVNKFLTEQDVQNATVMENQTQGEVQEIQEQIQEKEKQIAALDEQLMNLTNQVAEKEALSSEEKKALRDQIAVLEEQIAAREKELEALQEKDSDLEKRIALLEEQIAALQELLEKLSAEQDAAVTTEATSETEEVRENVKEEISALEEEKQILEEVQEITDGSFETMLLFDVSLSAQIVEGNKSRFEKGIDAAKYYVQEKGLYSVMIVGKNAIIVRRKIESTTVLRTLKYLRPLDTQSNLGRALSAAAEQLGNSGRIVLISDMQTTDGTDIMEIKNKLEQQGIDVIFVNIAETEQAEQTEQAEPISERESMSQREEEDSEKSDTDKTGSEGPIFDVESQTVGKFFIEIPKNTKYSIDLSKYFIDEDNDSLVYTAEPGEHLSTIIEENNVIIIPEQDWSGETFIIFGADDEKGGKAEGPAIKVIVTQEEMEETEQGQSTPELSEVVPWIILGSIIVLILVSLVAGAFARKFHKEPEIPENKEETEEKKKEE